MEDKLEELEQIEKWCVSYLQFYFGSFLFFSMSYCLEINLSCFLKFFWLLGSTIYMFENSSLNGDECEVVFV